MKHEKIIVTTITRKIELDQKDLIRMLRHTPEVFKGVGYLPDDARVYTNIPASIVRYAELDIDCDTPIIVTWTITETEEIE